MLPTQFRRSFRLAIPRLQCEWILHIDRRRRYHRAPISRFLDAVAIGIACGVDKCGVSQPLGFRGDTGQAVWRGEERNAAHRIQYVLDDDGVTRAVVADLRERNIDASLKEMMVPENPFLAERALDAIGINRLAGENDQHFPQTVDAPTCRRRIVDGG